MVFAPTFVFAQSVPEPIPVPGGALEARLTLAARPSNSFGGIGAGVALSVGSPVWGVRAACDADIGGLGWESPDHVALSCGLAGEYRAHDGPLQVSAHAGPAIVWGERRNSAEDFVTGGLEVGGDASVMPLAYLGLGVGVRANLNPVLPVAGAHVALKIRLTASGPARTETR